MSGLDWKSNAEEVIDRRRRFFRREMQDGILACLPVAIDTESEWLTFEEKWGTYTQSRNRPFPSNEEIYDRMLIGLQQRAKVEDDSLPVVYSILDAGESMVGGMFGMPMRFIHRPRGPAFSKADPVIADYADVPWATFEIENTWAQRFLLIQEHFEQHAGSNFAQHPCLTMDALNFAVEMRGATQAYMDIYIHTEELRALMEVGLDFNVRFQEAQMGRIGGLGDGCYVWLGGWVPFPRAVSLSVDAYVICAVKSYVEMGFEYQARLIEHFGHGLMHFHCARSDLAAEVAKLPGLELFQFGGDTRDPVPEIDRVPEIREAVGDIPIQVSCPQQEFRQRMSDGTLQPNVWYMVSGPAMDAEEANRLMGLVRDYRA